MSDQQPQSGSNDMASDAGPADKSSSNGVHVEPAVAVVEPTEASDAPTVDSTAAGAAAADATASEATADEIAAEPIAADEPTAAEAAQAPTAAETEPWADDGAAFLAQLTLAMRTTAGAERTRIDWESSQRRDTQLSAIQARREAEVAAMRNFAADDLKSIDEWAEGERQRIDLERERRAATLQDDLDRSLAEHATKIDREIELVEAAVAEYRVEADAFFATLEQETDPVAIALHARRRPVFPNFEAIPEAMLERTAPPAEALPSSIETANPAATAPVEPVAEPTNGTTDADFPASLADAWAGFKDGPASVELAEALTADRPVPDGDAEPAIVIGGATDGQAPGEVLKSVPIYRPFGWFSGDKKGARKDGE
jgi:hypothetical protein